MNPSFADATNPPVRQPALPRLMLAMLLSVIAANAFAAPPPAPPTDDAAFARQMHEAMARMERDMQRAPMTGDADRDFVTMMLPHHQGAIEMAAALLARTRDPELRNLAQAIVTEQATEIALMRSWLERHPPPTPHQEQTP